MKKIYQLFQKAASLLIASHLFLTASSQPVLDYMNPVSGFDSPIDIVAEPGTNRLFVVQQFGLIRIVSGTSILPDPYLNIGPLLSPLGGEVGLLSMAFHPNYTTNGYFFVYYNNLAGDITLARYQRDEVSNDSASVNSGVVLLTIPKEFSNHNGGKLNFGPDGNLYFGTGDGGSANDPYNHAQDGNSLLGKMIRINVDNFATPPYYTIPADNPFTGASPINDAIWALGLRNPWRWSFDRSNGDLWIADVGQSAWEEVNYLSFATAAAGINYGWRCMEGNHVNTNVAACTPTGGTYKAPVFEYGHNNATGGFSITGGYMYRGTAYPELNGYYVTADYVSGNLWLVKPDGSFILQDNLPSNISSFGEDNNGELYAVSLTAGTLYRVVVTGVLPVKLVSFTGKSFSGYNEIRWTTGMEENTEKFVIEYTAKGNDYLVAGEVASTLNSNGASYSFRHMITNNGILRYRLRIVDKDRLTRYSPVITINSQGSKEIKVYPTVITNNTLQIISGYDLERIDIFSPDGIQVFTRSVNGMRGYFNLALPALHKGMYLVRIAGRDFIKTEKIFIK